MLRSDRLDLLACAERESNERARAERETRNANSYLIRLPPELRNEIYRMCLPPKQQNKDIPTNIRTAINEGSHVSLIRTCRLLRREVLLIFFRTSRLFSAVLVDEHGLQKWNTNAEKIVTRTFTKQIAPCLSLQRVQFQIVLYCSACAIYGLKPMVSIDIEIPDHGSSAAIAVNQRLRGVKGFYMKEPLAVVGSLEGMVKRLNCPDLRKKKSSGVEKRDVVDTMEAIKKIVEGNRKRKWTKVWGFHAVFETK